MIRFKNAFVEGYGESITEFTINGDEKDFAPHVLKVSQTNPDVIILLSFPQSGAQFLKEYISTKGKLPQIAFDANAQSGFEDYKRILNGGEVLKGSIIATVSSKISDEFKVAYKNRFGNEPGVFADIGYDAFKVLMETHNEDGKKWIKNVENSNISGVSGKIEFDGVGVRKPEVNIVRIADGKIPTN
jgi:branched-chain amino acid transport system substrate-binding protein